MVYCKRSERVRKDVVMNVSNWVFPDCTSSFESFVWRSIDGFSFLVKGMLLGLRLFLMVMLIA